MARESRMVLLPTRSSTASSCFASAMRLDRSGPSCSTRAAPNASSLGERSPLRVVAMTRAPALTAILTAAWPKRRERTADHQGLALGDLKIAKEARPCRRVGLRDRGQLGPGQVRFDERHIRDARAGVFGITTVDGAAESAHQRRHFGPDREFAAGAG